MKLSTIGAALLTLLLCVFSSVGQNPPPPSLPSDYFPEKWKEYAYDSDNFRVRLPAEPKLTASTDASGGMTVLNHTYVHKSFIEFSLSVYEYPPQVDFAKAMPVKDILLRMQDAGFAEISKFQPKLIKTVDTSIGGHLARFVHFEANNGEVLRAKVFVVKNRMYFLYASVKKGNPHGVNHENDFEKPTMAFLDSFQLIRP